MIRQTDTDSTDTDSTDQSHDRRADPTLGRRRLLQATGAAAVGALAGCATPLPDDGGPSGYVSSWFWDTSTGNTTGLDIATETMRAALDQIDRRADVDLNFPEAGSLPMPAREGTQGAPGAVSEAMEAAPRGKSAQAFVEQLVRYIVTGDGFIEDRRAEIPGGYLQPGAHFVLSHNVDIENGAPLLATIDDIETTIPVHVEGHGTYYATTLGPLKRLKPGNPLEDPWELRQFARQAVGHVLGATHVDGGYAIGPDPKPDWGKETIVDISPMATGHVYDRYGYRDTSFVYRDEPYVAGTAAETDEDGTLRTVEGDPVVNGTRRVIPDFDGGTASANPQLDYQHFDEMNDDVDEALSERGHGGPDKVRRAELADNHTSRYTARTINAIEKTLSGESRTLFADDWEDGNLDADPAWTEVERPDSGSFETGVVNVGTSVTIPGGGTHVLRVTETAGGGTVGEVRWEEFHPRWHGPWVLRGRFYTHSVPLDSPFQAHSIAVSDHRSLRVPQNGDRPLRLMIGFRDSDANPIGLRLYTKGQDGFESAAPPGDGWQEGTWYDYRLTYDGACRVTATAWEATSVPPADPDVETKTDLPDRPMACSVRANGASNRPFEIYHSGIEWRIPSR